MIDRRILLASAASLLGLAAFRWLRASPAEAAEKFEIEKTDSECCGPKSTAAAAVAISVTSSMMGRSRPGYATALTALRWCFDRQRRQRAEASPGNCCRPGNCAPVYGPGHFHLSR